jgi:hypothetical protein
MMDGGSSGIADPIVHSAIPVLGFHVLHPVRLEAE